MTYLSIDAIILTFNEEENIEQCLKSIVGLVKNIYIVDSESTDGTVNIANKYNCHVVSNKFVNQAIQLNWALDNLPIQSEWVLRLDADEYLLPELKDEIASVIPSLSSEVTGLYLKRRLIFLGRWIRHGGHYPTWLLRMFRYGKARSELVDINEHIVLLEGRGDSLKNDFVDCNHKNLEYWLLKHEKHAKRKAVFFRKLETRYDPTWIPPRLFGVQAERKRWLMQNIFLRCPLFFRAFLFFFYRYFLRLGFLDGVQGLIYHFLHGCWYPFYTDAKLYEYLQKNVGAEQDIKP